ncbi:hypothetical protein RN001_005813 [Aquatica leii]|uniref:MADF domain-containing protein n=1 Tax=Aquatica leii TaxID=1421715 RepID=A0AAN7SJ79_9COLE|nr:hypothetical protein RN001_005813 [Aquatica leii]
MKTRLCPILIQQFQQCDTVWHGELEYKGLFEFWKDLQINFHEKNYSNHETTLENNNLVIENGSIVCDSSIDIQLDDSFWLKNNEIINAEVQCDGFLKICESSQNIIPNYENDPPSKESCKILMELTQVLHIRETETKEIEDVNSSYSQVEETDSTDETIQDTLVELLISEISKRPPLFNEKLHLHERSRSIKNALEKEVYEALGQMALPDISKKWAYLKKEYKRHRQQLNKYVNSGCSLDEAIKITGKPLWKHYKSLMFIDDIAHDITTESNVPVCELSVCSNGPSTSSSSGNMIESPTQSDTSVSHEKRKSSTSQTLLDSMIINEINKSNKLDSTNHFCSMLALEMRKLDGRKRAELQIKFLTLLNEELYN